MTTVVNVDDTNLTVRELLDRAAPGDEVVLERGGVVVARVTCEQGSTPARRNVQWGFLKGKAWVSDDFFAPMSEEELAGVLVARVIPEPKPEPSRKGVRFGLLAGQAETLDPDWWRPMSDAELVE